MRERLLVMAEHYFLLCFFAFSCWPPSIPLVYRGGGSHPIIEFGEETKYMQLSPSSQAWDIPEGWKHILSPCCPRQAVTSRSYLRGRGSPIQERCVSKPTKLTDIKPILRLSLYLQLPDCCITFNWFLDGYKKKWEAEQQTELGLGLRGQRGSISPPRLNLSSTLTTMNSPCTWPHLGLCLYSYPLFILKLPFHPLTSFTLLWPPGQDHLAFSNVANLRNLSIPWIFTAHSLFQAVGHSVMTQTFLISRRI